MDGIHLLGEWYGCPADLPEMTRADALRGRCIEAVERAGMRVDEGQDATERFFDQATSSRSR